MRGIYGLNFGEILPPTAPNNFADLLLRARRYNSACYEDGGLALAPGSRWKRLDSSTASLAPRRVSI